MSVPLLAVGHERVAAGPNILTSLRVSAIGSTVVPVPGAVALLVIVSISISLLVSISVALPVIASIALLAGFVVLSVVSTLVARQAPINILNFPGALVKILE